MLSRLVPALTAATALSCGFMILTGMKSCGSSSATDPDEEEAICKGAQECEGLPHIDCDGAWSCDEGQCAWSCEVPEPPPDPYEKCQSDADCADGWCDFTECVGASCEGVCRDKKPDPTECQADSECGAGFYCQLTCAAGKRAPTPDGDADAPIWDPYPCVGQCVEKDPEPQGCTYDGECGKGYHCQSTCDYPGVPTPADDNGSGGADFAPMPPPCPGQCVKDDPQPTECSYDGECGPGFYCAFNCGMSGEAPADDNGADAAMWCPGQCVKKDPEPTGCTYDAECGYGYRCETWCDGGGAPVPMDEDGDGDPDDASFWAPVCDGQCVPVEQPVQCNTDADCPSGTSCQCTSDPTCPMCDVCFFQCVKQETPVYECTSDAECADGLTCNFTVCSGCACEGGATDCDCPPPMCWGQCGKPVPEPVSCETDSQCGDGQVCELFCSKMACWDGWCPPCTGTCVDSEPPPQPETCVVSGCSGEICAPEPMASDCSYDPAYECLQYTKCGSFGANGSCGWIATPEYEKCLSQYK